MANIVYINKLLDGPSKAVISIYLHADGASGELSNEVLIDPRLDLVPSCSKITVEEILFSFSGFQAVIAYGQNLITTNQLFTLPDRTAMVDFKPFGGFADLTGLDGNGKLVLFTTGFNVADNRGSLIIKLRKSRNV